MSLDVGVTGATMARLRLIMRVTPARRRALGLRGGSRECGLRCPERDALAFLSQVATFWAILSAIVQVVMPRFSQRATLRRPVRLLAVEASFD